MTIYIVDIEPVETRYTAQWKKYLPEQLKVSGIDTQVISGGEVPHATTPGAFLNFGGTNVYKSNQLQQIATLFCEGKIHDGDYFLYTDAWNPTVIQLRYMASLLDINIAIGGMWHAGSYDPQDFLGRLIGNAKWVRLAEASMFECYDDNFFATDFHVELFQKTFPIKKSQATIVGWPMEYLKKELAPYKDIEKENIILFPHRVAPEKQPEIFKDLALYFPDYQFIIAQNKELTKHESHELLAKSKMVFSANLQETLGISWYEAALVGTLPLVPDRLSYTEMAIPEVVYDSDWTMDWDSYLKYKSELISRMNYLLDSNNKDNICANVVEHADKFFDGTKLYNTVKEHSINEDFR